MARVTVEDCIDKVENRFDLVLLASHRAQNDLVRLCKSPSNAPTIRTLWLHCVKSPTPQSTG